MTMQPTPSSPLASSSIPVPPPAPSPPNLSLSSQQNNSTSNLNNESSFRRNTSLTRPLPHPRVSAVVPPRGTVYVVERLGRFNRLVYANRPNPPLLPLVDRVVAAYTTSRVKQSTSSNGILAAIANTRVRVHATWILRVVDPKRLAYRIADVDRCIVMIISVRIRDSLANINTDMVDYEQIQSLNPIAQNLQKDIHQTCSKFGVSCLSFRFESVQNLIQQQLPQEKKQQPISTSSHSNSIGHNMYSHGPQNNIHPPKSLNIADAYHSTADYYNAAAIDSVLPELPSDNVTHPSIAMPLPPLPNLDPHSQPYNNPHLPYHNSHYPLSPPLVSRKRHQRTYWNHQMSTNYSYDTMASNSQPSLQVNNDQPDLTITENNALKKSPSPVPLLSKVVLPTAHSPPPKSTPPTGNYSPRYFSENDENGIPNAPIDCPPMSPLPKAGTRKKESFIESPSSLSDKDKEDQPSNDDNTDSLLSEVLKEDPAPAPPPTPQVLSTNSAASDTDTMISDVEKEDSKERDLKAKDQESQPKDTEPVVEATLSPEVVKTPTPTKLGTKISPEKSNTEDVPFSTQDIQECTPPLKKSSSVLYAPPPSPTGETEESVDFTPELLPMALSRVLVSAADDGTANIDRKADPPGIPDDRPLPTSTVSATGSVKSPPLASYLDNLPPTPQSDLPSSENGSDTPTDREEVQALVLRTPGVEQTETSMSSLPSEIPSSSVTGDEPIQDAADVPNAVQPQERSIENPAQVASTSNNNSTLKGDSTASVPNLPIVPFIMPERPVQALKKANEATDPIKTVARKDPNPLLSSQKSQQSVLQGSTTKEAPKRRVTQPASSILQTVERAIKNAGASLASDLIEAPIKMIQSQTNTSRIKGSPPPSGKKALRLDMPREALHNRPPPPPPVVRPSPHPGTARSSSRPPEDHTRRMGNPYENTPRESHLPRPRDMNVYPREDELLEGRISRRGTPRYVGHVDSVSRQAPMPRGHMEDPRLRPPSMRHPRMDPLGPDHHLLNEEDYNAIRDQRRRNRPPEKMYGMEQWRGGYPPIADDTTDNDSTEMWVDAGSDSEREKFDDDAVSQMSQSVSHSSRRRRKSRSRRRQESSSRRRKSSKSRKRIESDSEETDVEDDDMDDEERHSGNESSSDEVCTDCGHHHHHGEIDDTESHRSSSRKSRSRHSSSGRHGSDDVHEKSSSSRSHRRNKASSERSVDSRRSGSTRDRSSRSKKGSSRDKDRDTRRKSEREESVSRRSKSNGDRKRSQSKSNRSSKKRRDDADERVRVKASKSKQKDIGTTFSYNPYSYDAVDVKPIYRHRLPDSDSGLENPIPWYCEGQSAPEDTDVEDANERSDDSDRYMNSMNYTSTTFSSYGRKDKYGRRHRAAHNRRVRFLYDDLR